MVPGVPRCQVSLHAFSKVLRGLRGEVPRRGRLLREGTVELGGPAGQLREASPKGGVLGSEGPPLGLLLELRGAGQSDVEHGVNQPVEADPVVGDSAAVLGVGDNRLSGGDRDLEGRRSSSPAPP